MRLSLASLFFIASLCFCASSCVKSHSKNKSKETPVLTAYRLIDENRTDEAIVFLENRIKAEPQNIEYQVVLASAYAHKGGVSIQKLIPLLKLGPKIKNAQSLQDDFNAPANTDTPGNPEGDPVILLLKTLVSKFSFFFDVYSGIPSLTNYQSEFVSHAITILAEIKSQLQPGDILYKAVLEIIFLKYQFSNYFSRQSSSTNEFVKIDECQVDFSKLEEAFTKMGSLFLAITSDIEVAIPSEAENMRRLSDKTVNALSDLSLYLSSPEILETELRKLVNKFVIETSGRKEILCQE